MTQHGLFIFPIHQQKLHGDILGLAEQRRDFGVLLALRLTQLVPGNAHLLEVFVRLFEPWKQAISGFPEGGGVECVLAAEGLILAFDDAQQFQTERQVIAQNLRRVF